MLNVLFDRVTFKATGTNRSPLAFEVSIDDVICDNLTKVVEVPEEVVKPSVFLLPQEPLEETITNTSTIETTEITDNPVMTTVYEKVPAGFGYYRTALGMVTEPTDEPVMSEEVDEDGNVVEVHAMDTDDNLLYWGQVPTNEWIDCYTTEEKQVHKTDTDGNPLYLKEVEEVTTQLVEQPPLEISIEDERWTPDLQPATEFKMTTKVLDFPNHMGDFTYDEVLAHKEKITADGSLHRSEAYQKSKGVNIYEKTFDLGQQDDLLDDRTKGMQDIDTFTLDKTFLIDGRTEGMKEIDDFTLDMVFGLMARIEVLEEEVKTLKGGN